MSESEVVTEITTRNGSLTIGSMVHLSWEQEKEVITNIARVGESQTKEGDNFYLLSWR